MWLKMKIRNETSEIPLSSQEGFISFSRMDFSFLRSPRLSLSHILVKYSLKIVCLPLKLVFLKDDAKLPGTSYPKILLGVRSVVKIKEAKESGSPQPPTHPVRPTSNVSPST